LSLQDGDTRIPEFGREKPSGWSRIIAFFGYQTSSERVTHITPFGRQHSLGADLSAFAGCSAIPLNLLKLIIQHAGEGSEECACWNCII